MPYRKTIQEIEKMFQTNKETGLDLSEAAQRLERFGKNEIEGKKNLKNCLFVFWLDLFF